MKFTKMYAPDGELLELVLSEAGEMVNRFGLPEGSELVEPDEANNVAEPSADGEATIDPASFTEEEKKAIFGDG